MSFFILLYFAIWVQPLVDARKMKLLAYLKQNKITQTEFAKRVGIARPYLSLVIHRKHTPSIRLIEKIEKATEGKVAFIDFFEEKLKGVVSDIKADLKKELLKTCEKRK